MGGVRKVKGGTGDCHRGRKVPPLPAITLLGLGVPGGGPTVWWDQPSRFEFYFLGVGSGVLGGFLGSEPALFVSSWGEAGRSTFPPDASIFWARAPR
jgi:hypothetical protein